MRTTTCMQFYQGKIGRNFSNFFSTFLALFFLLTLATTSVYAQDASHSTSYQQNNDLSRLLDQEQFQMGLSCDQAMSAYKLDVKTNKGNNSRIVSSQIGLHDGKLAAPGFFRGTCHNGKLSYVDKIVTVKEGVLDRKEVLDSFVRQYGEPMLRGRGDVYVRYLLSYKGSNADFRLTIRQANNRTLWIYELEDVTVEATR